MEVGSPRFAARLLAYFAWFSGAAAIAASFVAGDVPSHRPGLARFAGLCAVAIGVAVSLVPWERLGRRSIAAALPPCYAFMATMASLAEGSFTYFTFFYLVPFVMLALWTGLALPRWTYTKLLPFSVVAYAAPFLADDIPLGLTVASTLFVVPICALVAEVVAWILMRLSQTTDSLTTATEQLSVSEARFRAMVDGSYDVTLITDRNGILTFVSANAATAFGLVPAELVGRNPLEVVHVEDHLMMLSAFREVVFSDGTALVGPLWLRFVHPKTGDIRPVEVFAKSLLRDQTVGGIVVSARDITERHQFETTLARRAEYDPLTQILNRGAFLERLEAALARDARGAAVFVDLNGFKQINDRHGHHVGDLVLVEAARRIAHVARRADLVARYGGDEFVVLLNAADESYMVEDFVYRLRAALDEPVVIDDLELVVGLSVGHTVIQPDDRNAAEVIRRADLAMYEAKESARVPRLESVQA